MRAVFLSLAIAAVLLMGCGHGRPTEGQWVADTCRDHGGAILYTPSTVMKHAAVTCQDGHAETR